MTHRIPLHPRRLLAAALLSLLPILAAPPLAASPAARAAEALAPAPAPTARPIRLIVPFAPGGSTDNLARAMAAPVGRRLGASLVVENRAGAGGLIGSETCARAAPDGHTLCIGASATHSVLPHQQPPGRIGADPAGFTPIARIAEEPQVLAVRRGGRAAPALEPFLAWARQQPLVHFGVAGITNTSYLMTVQLARAAGFSPEPVLYRGGNLIASALVAGEVPVAVGPLSSFLGQIQAGEALPVLVLGPSRTPVLPEVPALGETVLPGLSTSAYLGLFGPAGIAPAMAERIGAAVQDSFRDPLLRAWAESQGLVLQPMGPGEFAAWLRRTAPDWAALVALTADPPAPLQN